VPLEVVRRLVNGESPLLVWREYRGFTQAELAKRAKLKGHSYIVAIEKRQKPGSVSTMKVSQKPLTARWMIWQVNLADIKTIGTPPIEWDKTTKKA